MSENSTTPNEKPSTTLPGTVEKIIKPPHPGLPEKAQIAVEGGDDLYREIRIENTLKGDKGEDVALKEGAPVEVTVEADKKDTIKRQARPETVFASALSVGNMIRCPYQPNHRP